MRQNLTRVLREYLRLGIKVSFATGFGGVQESFIRYADMMQANDSESFEKPGDKSIFNVCSYKSSLD